jgi:hypothetical protein
MYIKSIQERGRDLVQALEERYKSSWMREFILLEMKEKEWWEGKIWFEPRICAGSWKVDMLGNNTQVNVTKASWNRNTW